MSEPTWTADTRRDRSPCVWCNAPTVGRNQDNEPLCGDYECQKDDHSHRLRKENP